MSKRTWILAAGAAAALAGAAAVLAHPGHDAPADGAARELEVIVTGDELGGRLVLEGLDELAVGESRSYTTESGKSVVAKRDEKGFTLDVDGREIRLGGFDGTPEPGARIVRRQRVEVDGEGGEQVWISRSCGGPGGHDVRVLRELDGAHGFAFSTGEGAFELPLPIGFDALLGRLEGNEKFQSLDDATQALVREALREAVPRLPSISHLEDGDGKLRVIVRERVQKPQQE